MHMHMHMHMRYTIPALTLRSCLRTSKKIKYIYIYRYFENDKVLTGALYGLTDIRGKENAEMQGEIQGLADQSGLPLKFVQGIQMLYELQTLMVPIVNITDPSWFPMPKGWEALARIPWRGETERSHARSTLAHHY